MQKIPLPKNIGSPATNALQAHNIYHLEDLEKISEKSLEEMHGVGPKAIRILKEELTDNGLSQLK